EMLWLLFFLLPPVSNGSIVAKNITTGGPTVTPHIYFCRSPNMEDFACWWHPLSNLTDGEQVTHILTYSTDQEANLECPDYVTGGPNSCHFDSSHTSIWSVYCLTVTAITTHRNYTSQQHCLDVAEIVQTEIPVNVTYNLTNAGSDEMGQNALISWIYPVPGHAQYGWITLVYELQYRHVTESDNWKVKHPLREPQVELLGLRVDDYVVRVRCRAQHSKLWSDWSTTLVMSIPPKPSAGMSAGRWQYGKGNLDKINCHFSNFHSYRPPSSSSEVWDHVKTIPRG
uniref:Fibronectin type-III domain-containing protein n=1 Tax=Neolamprologus brichardi TaxID=32507 RepID=A0A3Q4I0P6_NEOBR